MNEEEQLEHEIGLVSKSLNKVIEQAEKSKMVLSKLMAKLNGN